MKTAPTQLIDFLDAVRNYYDGQLVIADAFLFALRNGTSLGYTNSDAGFADGGQLYLADDVLVDGLKYKAAVGLALCIGEEDRRNASLSTGNKFFETGFKTDQVNAVQSHRVAELSGEPLEFCGPELKAQLEP